jgi:hypothetical protein
VALTMSYDLPCALAGMDVGELEAENAEVLDVVLLNLKSLSENGSQP